jgi:hypothetical protein
VLELGALALALVELEVLVLVLVVLVVLAFRRHRREGCQRCSLSNAMACMVGCAACSLQAPCCHTVLVLMALALVMLVVLMLAVGALQQPPAWTNQQLTPSALWWPAPTCGALHSSTQRCIGATTNSNSNSSKQGRQCREASGRYYGCLDSRTAPSTWLLH